MSKHKWTINNAGGGADSSDLVGCHIKETDDGYDFLEPDNTVLSSTTETAPPFTFPDFDYEDWTWTITVDSLATSGVSGSWSNNNSNITAEEGTWSTGTGTEDEQEEAAAAGT